MIVNNDKSAGHEPNPPPFDINCADFLWHLHYPLDRYVGKFARINDPVEHGDDVSLIERIIKCYRISQETALGDKDNFWLSHFASVNSEEYNILSGGDFSEIANLLRNPVKYHLFHGFDGINAADQRELSEEWWRWLSAVYVYDFLLTLSQALGCYPLENPEAAIRGIGPDVEEILNRLDEVLGFRIDFPNPFEGELGIMSSRGLISTRAVLCLHQVWRMFEIVNKNKNARLLEIGAGLGRNAYYAQKLGVKSYTIIDLPTTNVCQANFLGRVLDGGSINLYGESNRSAQIQIMPQSYFIDGNDRYDLIVNVDSMTEFSKNTALEYIAAIERQSNRFLSINHEANSFNISGIVKGIRPNSQLSRTPWWMKRGYIEEIFNFG